MEFFRSAPFLRILPAFCFGVVVNVFSDISPLVISFLFSLGATGILYQLSRKRNRFNHYYTGFFFQFIFFSLGYGLCQVKDDRLSNRHFSRVEADKYFARILSEPKMKSGRLRAEAEIYSVYRGESVEKSCGKCFIYFYEVQNLRCNDEVVFEKSPVPISPPLNPGAFDFQFYSSLHRIYHDVRLYPNDFTLLDSAKSLLSFSIDLRNRFLNSFKAAGMSGQEYAVMSALVLGYDDEIDKETMHSFSASGTLHILSVSGMHVGIVFTALSFLLKFAEKKKQLRVFRVVVLLLCLWFYALLTGLSPSVIRSAMMFSFILLGRTFSRSSGIYNSLALTAFTIFLLFDPLLMLQPGFQLSFIAVAGIAYFYPLLNELFQINNWLLEKIYSLTAVSVAAQLVTFPVSVYYFHQFPNYFIIANLIIIPLSTLAIFGGILLLALNGIPFLATKLGFICSKLVFVLNESALLIERLPGSTLNNITIGLPEVILLLIFFFVVFDFFKTRYLLSLRISLLTLILVFGFVIQRSLAISRANQIIIFSRTKDICFQYNRGERSELFYKAVDSLNALNISNDFCNKFGYSLSNRRTHCLSDTISNFLYQIKSDTSIALRNFPVIYLYATDYSNEIYTDTNSALFINDYYSRKPKQYPKQVHLSSNGALIINLAR